jgi:hypothetical protein
MALPRFIEIDGRRYLWRDLVTLRRAQATPAGELDAAERYSEPNLFTVLERRR